MKDHQYQITPKESKPFHIIIKNNTDEKILNVNLLEPNHKSLDKISYSTNNANSSYSDILKFFNESEEISIGLIVFIAYCNYTKYKRRQLNTLVYVKDIENGEEKLVEKLISFNTYQMLDTLSVARFDIKFSKTTNLVLPFLMPETELEILLYPDYIIKSVCN